MLAWLLCRAKAVPLTRGGRDPLEMDDERMCVAAPLPLGRAAAVAVAAAVSLVGGLFMKGSNINYPAGTDFQVEVRDNVDLGVTPEELKDAMNPNIPHGQEIVIEVK